MFLPPLETMLGGANAFEEVLAHAEHQNSIWPVAQLLAACFELSHEGEGLLFVHVMPDGGERVVWWDRGEGFSRPVATDARLFLGAYDAFQKWHRDRRAAPFARAVDAARHVLDWPEWPPIEWVETFGWHDDVAKLGALPALPKTAFRASERLRRALWLAELLVRGRVEEMPEPSEDEEDAKPPARIADYMPDILYWLWHSAAFGDDETRHRLIARAQSSRSRVVRDAGATLLERMRSLEEREEKKRSKERAKKRRSGVRSG
ncbi:MAG: hypothetical protein KIT84_08135 [Labilithrix sp.]|nr:hypothetical protein [Labilithrix sp.]MCW5810966.1 hypothetical protein [Labilithrix sp.]